MILLVTNSTVITTEYCTLASSVFDQITGEFSFENYKTTQLTFQLDPSSLLFVLISEIKVISSEILSVIYSGNETAM